MHEPPTRSADIVAFANLHDLGYWRAHPDVEHVASAPCADRPGGQEIQLWLKPVEVDDVAPAHRERGTPARAYDLDLGGEGEPHPTFWDRCPDVERLILMFDCEGDWWAARLWLKEAPSP